VTEQISSGPAGTRRWPLPVIFTEPDDDGSEEVESSVQEFTGSAAHQVAFHAWQSAASDVCAAFATRMSIGPDSASIRRRIFSMPAQQARSAGSCIAWPPSGPLTEVWRPEQPGAMLVLEAADLAEAGDVAAGLPLAGAAQDTADLIPLHLQTA
jgi:hypothetical protein